MIYGVTKYSTLTCSPTNPVPQPASTTTSNLSATPPVATSNAWRRRLNPSYPKLSTRDVSKLDEVKNNE
jgi:hypothetical protein